MKNARLVVLALLIALLAAGCGSSSGGSGGADDPAALVPASAPLYAEAIVRPQGQVRAGAEAALRKILRTNDPGAAITKALEKGSGQAGDLSFQGQPGLFQGGGVNPGISGAPPR